MDDERPSSPLLDRDMSDKYVASTEQVVVGVSSAGISNEVQDLHKQIASKDKEIESLKASKATLEQQCSEYVREMEELRTGEESLVNQLRESKKQNNTLKEQHDALSAEMNALKQQFEALKAEKVELESP